MDKNKIIFNDQDYNSSSGMVTSVWGPPLWFSLHVMSFNYPVNPTSEQSQQYYAYFTSLQWTLPCKYCRDNYAKNLEELPLDKKVLKNRESFSRWLYNMHNKVNINLGKETYKTYEEVREFYEHFRARCTVERPIDGKEKGCTVPLHGEKGKTLLAIVPEAKVKYLDTLNVSEKCKKSI